MRCPCCGSVKYTQRTNDICGFYQCQACNRISNEYPAGCFFLREAYDRLLLACKTAKNGDNSKLDNAIKFAEPEEKTY